MTLHDSRYKHWDGRHLGIWRRRAVIAGAGLKGCLQGKWMRHMITLCWSAALAQVGVLFLIGQLLVKDSLILNWANRMGGAPQMLANTLIGWLEQHPEISVRATQNVMFYFFSSLLLTFSIIAIALALPHLITRDLSSRAMIIYASKAISRFDYFLGKFSTLMGLMTMTWLGPLVLAWLIGNLLAPNWSFFWHSRIALGHVLLFVLSSMVMLSLIALGVSACSAKEKATVSFWIALWLLGNAMVGLASVTKPWLKFVSFRYNLDQLSLAVFRLGHDLELVQENLPILGGVLRNLQRGPNAVWKEAELTGALWGLAIMIALAIVILNRKVKPE